MDEDIVDDSISEENWVEKKAWPQTVAESVITMVIIAILALILFFILTI